MTEASALRPPDTLKAYKSYPKSHFSRLRTVYYRAILSFIVRPFFFYKYDIHITGRENIPKSGPFIVAANHISLLDPLMISYALHFPVAYMAKSELFNTPVKRLFYRSVGTFALDRDAPDSASLKTALNVLHSPAKWALGIFPEGTRSLTGELLPFKKGLGILAVKNQVPVLPVGVSKSGEKTFHITIGTPITRLSDADTVQAETYEALNSLIHPTKS